MAHGPQRCATYLRSCGSDVPWTNGRACFEVNDISQPAAPLHPGSYSSVPSARPYRTKTAVALKGDVPSPINPPSGCRFHIRCPIATGRCRVDEPLLREVSGHSVVCHPA
ncbi:oligopeptide/dipeptide ABC transporter ATP-binding protein [Mesorhizobium sp. SARCC-RB16n]|uniref:oligopeptide/dipeptide ABC transporter ATP-binding protein n=1 Tax=Mesorhizobium sp. SARCC-RB16n TaxID=2116687 RepID=UPI001FED6A04|nr:oligopeptide/dipeptide ABC transporter ATP-binding protein [Mesorhizobium sp. SARCC-RB16n]